MGKERFCDECNTRKELVFDIDSYFTKEFLETFNKFYKKSMIPDINSFEFDELKDIEHIFLYFVILHYSPSVISEILNYCKVFDYIDWKGEDVEILLTNSRCKEYLDESWPDITKGKDIFKITQIVLNRYKKNKIEMVESSEDLPWRYSNDDLIIYNRFKIDPPEIGSIKHDTLSEISDIAFEQEWDRWNLKKMLYTNDDKSKYIRDFIDNNDLSKIFSDGVYSARDDRMNKCPQCGKKTLFIKLSNSNELTLSCSKTKEKICEFSQSKLDNFTLDLILDGIDNVFYEEVQEFRRGESLDAEEGLKLGHPDWNPEEEDFDSYAERHGLN